MQRTLRTSSKRSASANERRTNSPFITNAPLSVENGEPYNDTLEKNYAPLNDYQTVEDVLLASDQQLAVTANYETQHVVYHPQRHGVAEIRERDRRIATLSSELTMIRSRLKSAVDAKNEAEKAVQKIRNENNAFIREIEGLRVRTASLQSLVERITKEKDDAVVFAEREKSRARAADAAARGAEQRRNLDSISMQTQLRQMQEHPRRFHDELRRMKERLIDQEHYIVDLRRENYRLAQLLKEGHVFAVPTASLPLSKEVALEHSSTLYDSSEKVLNANHSENQKGTQSSLREMARSASSGSSYAAPQRTSTQRYTSSSSLAMVPIRLPHHHRSVTPPNEPSAYRKRVTRRESMSSTLSGTLGKQRSASGDGYVNPASLERLNTATAPQLQRMGSTANRIKMPSLVSSTQSSAFVSTPSTSASPRALPPGTVRPGESLTLPGSPTSHHTSGSVGTWRPNVSTGRVSRAAPSPFTRTVTSIELESGSVPAAPQQHSSRTVSRSPSIHGNALRTNSTLPVEPASRGRGIPAEIDDIPFICLDSEVAWNGLMGFVRYVGPTQLGDGVWTGVELLTSTSPNVHGSRSSGWSHNPTSERYFTRTYKDQGSIGILCRPWELRTARSASSTANSSRYVTQSSAKASWDHSVGGEYREIDQLLESIEDDWGPLAIRPYFDDDPSKDTGKKNTKGESHLQRSSPPKEQKLEVQTSDLTASLKVVPQQSASTSRRSSRTPHRNVQPPNK